MFVPDLKNFGMFVLSAGILHAKLNTFSTLRPTVLCVSVPQAFPPTLVALATAVRIGLHASFAC